MPRGAHGLQRGAQRAPRPHSSLGPGPTLPPPPLALRLHSHPQKAWESAASASAGHLLLLLLLLLRSSLDLGRNVAWSSPARARGGLRSAGVRAPRHPHSLQLAGGWGWGGCSSPCLFHCRGARRAWAFRSPGGCNGVWKSQPPRLTCSPSSPSPPPPAPANPASRLGPCVRAAPGGGSANGYAPPRVRARGAAAYA